MKWEKKIQKWFFRDKRKGIPKYTLLFLEKKEHNRNGRKMYSNKTSMKSAIWKGTLAGKNKK